MEDEVSSIHVIYPTAVISPSSYTAHWNTTGIFHCAVTGSNIISWYVNGTPSDYPDIQNRGILTSQVASINATWSWSNLTIPATKENDQLSVYCTALVLTGHDGISETATFYVQGPPSPPTNLTIEASDGESHLIFRWNPPVLTNAFIVSMYTVYINISHTGIETRFNTTMRQYSIENPCSSVTFTVTAWNDIGEGNGNSLLYMPILYAGEPGDV